MLHTYILNLNVVIDFEKTDIISLKKIIIKYFCCCCLINEVKLIMLICIHFPGAGFCCHVFFMYCEINIMSFG